MNKRSKSENVIKLRKQLRQKQTKLEQLAGKIEQSQPILQTIYDKIRRKEEYMHQELNRSRRKVQVSREIANKYCELYKDGLKIINKNNFGMGRNQIHNQRSQTNYIKMLDKSTKIEEDSRDKGKSMYEKYLQKEKPIKINPEFKDVPNKMKTIQQQMNQGIQELKMIRKRSQNNLKKFRQIAYDRPDSSQSSQKNKAVQKVRTFVKTQQEKRRQMDREEIGKKYIQMNRKRLKQLS